MKRILCLFGSLFVLLSVFPQVPQGFNYQAVVRDMTGAVIADQTVSFRISILEESATGTELYSETHAVSTNGFGLANLVIGQGADNMGVFSPEGWGSGEHFIKIEVDESGGTNYTQIGTSQLLSVPYAFHAQTVEQDQVEDADADPVNEIQQLSMVGRSLSLSEGGGSVSIPEDQVDDADADPVNEIQQLSMVGRSLSLSDGGGTVSLPEDQVEDADADPVNEIQQLSMVGRSLSLSEGGGTVSLPEESGLSLPFSATVSTTDPAFSITNTNVGHTFVSIKTASDGSAGFFEIDNSASPADVLTSRTNGSGPAIFGYTSGLGSAASFIATKTDNSNNALSVTHYGRGHGGYFAIENENNGKNVVSTSNKGYGNGINSYCSGLGKAGYFKIDNTANINTALFATTNGTGQAAKFVVDNSGSGAEALFATSNGTGLTIFSECTSPTGSAGRFEIFNSSSSRSALQVITNGSGKAVYGSATNSGNLTNYGGYFEADGRTAYGVWAEATNAVGVNYGGHFSTASEQGRAIRGHATNTTGENYGGAFRADGNNSRGVWAFGQAYDYYAAGPGLNYGGASSIRWKSNLRPIPDPLEKLDQIRGVYFDWDEKHGGQKDVGMIAEEVGKVLPEIVAYEANGIDASGMDYGKLTPLLVEVCKALKAELDVVKTELEQLKRELDSE